MLKLDSQQQHKWHRFSFNIQLSNDDVAFRQMSAERYGIAISKKENMAYPNNLSWECVRCATCCGDTAKRTRHILVLVSEAQAIAARTGMRIEEFAYKVEDSKPYEFEVRKKNKRCVFLTGVSCGIYSDRPLICRFYPFILKQSKSRTFEFKLPEHECQGIGRGRKLTQDYYVSLLRIAMEKLTTHCRG